MRIRFYEFASLVPKLIRIIRGINKEKRAKETNEQVCDWMHFCFNIWTDVYTKFIWALSTI